MRLRDVPLRYRCSSITPATVTFSIVIIANQTLEEGYQGIYLGEYQGYKGEVNVPLRYRCSSITPAARHFLHRHHPKFGLQGGIKVDI